MARTLKEDEYSARRKEILNAALRLVYSKGYEKMTIQDVLDDLKISKGAFYHYFSSKQAMLEGLVERIAIEVTQLLQEIVNNYDLTALEKLERYILAAASWKTEHKSLILALMHAWYAEDNAIVRQATYASSMRLVSPLLSEIFRQGIREGVFHTNHPDRISDVFLCLVQGIGEAVRSLFLSPEIAENQALILDAMAVYTESMERVLGAPAGSIHNMFIKSINDWFEESKV